MIDIRGQANPAKNRLPFHRPCEENRATGPAKATSHGYTPFRRCPGSTTLCPQKVPGGLFTGAAAWANLVIDTGDALSSPRTVVLADDHAAMLEEVSRLLQNHFTILAMVSNGEAAVQAAKDLRPDLVVMDIAMPVLNGIQAARRMKEMGLRAKIVFLTIQNDPDYHQIAEQLGASYVLKPMMGTDLIPAINKTLDGYRFGPDGKGSGRAASTGPSSG